MHPDLRRRVFRHAFCAYLQTYAPRALNGLPIINRELLDAAAQAGQRARVTKLRELSAS